MPANSQVPRPPRWLPSKVGRGQTPQTELYISHSQSRFWGLEAGSCISDGYESQNTVVEGKPEHESWMRRGGRPME